MTRRKRIVLTGGSGTRLLEQGALKDGPTTRTVDWHKSLIQWHDTLKNVQHDVVL